MVPESLLVESLLPLVLLLRQPLHGWAAETERVVWWGGLGLQCR